MRYNFIPVGPFIREKAESAAESVLSYYDETDRIDHVALEMVDRGVDLLVTVNRGNVGNYAIVERVRLLDLDANDQIVSIDPAFSR